MRRGVALSTMRARRTTEPTICRAGAIVANDGSERLMGRFLLVHGARKRITLGPVGPTGQVSPPRAERRIPRMGQALKLSLLLAKFACIRYTRTSWNPLRAKFRESSFNALRGTKGRECPGSPGPLRGALDLVRRCGPPGPLHCGIATAGRAGPGQPWRLGDGSVGDVLSKAGGVPNRVGRLGATEDTPRPVLRFRSGADFRERPSRFAPGCRGMHNAAKVNLP